MPRSGVSVPRVACGGLVAAYGLYVLGYAVSAPSDPFGFGLLTGLLCSGLGIALVLPDARAVVRSGHVLTGAGFVRVVAVVAAVVIVPAAVGASMAHRDERVRAELCTAPDGEVYDCDDPRVRAPAPPAATPVG